MSDEEAMFAIVSLHEGLHILAAKLLRVQVVKVYLKGRTNFIRVKYDLNFSGELKCFLIRLAPWLLDLPFGLLWFKGFFRVLWLKIWFSSRRRLPLFVLSELRE